MDANPGGEIRIMMQELDHMKYAFPFLSILAVILLAAGGPARSGKPDAYGSWMKRPPDEWPRIAVINQIKYIDRRFPVAGCGFLLEVEGEVLAATAKHVLTYFKSARMESVDFEGTLESWKMFPKDHPSEVIVAGGLLNRNPSESLKGIPCGKDWLLFAVRKRSKKIQPLRFRATPLEKGEPVYVIGWRYTDKGCPQIVHPGKYVRSEKGAVCITVPKLIHNTVPGLSGSPVIDGKGYLIGIMSRGRGRIQRASPIAYPQEILKDRAGKAKELR